MKKINTTYKQERNIKIRNHEVNEWMNENFINVSMYLAKNKKIANWGHLTKVNTY